MYTTTQHVYSNNGTYTVTLYTQGRKDHPFWLYYAKNWLPIKEKWVEAFRTHLADMGNSTYNFIKSQFGHMKKSLNRYNAISECLTKMLRHCRVMEAQLRDEVHRYATGRFDPKGFGLSDPVAPLLQCCSVKCCEIVQKEFEAVEKATFEIVREKSTLFYDLVRNAATDSQYQVDKRSWICTCSIYHTYLVPCRHVAFSRQAIGKETLFPLSSFDRRWFVADMVNDFFASDGSVDVILPSAAKVRIECVRPVISKVVTSAEKFRLVREVTDELTAYMTACTGTSTFKEYLEKIRLLRDEICYGAGPDTEGSSDATDDTSIATPRTRKRLRKKTDQTGVCVQGSDSDFEEVFQPTQCVSPPARRPKKKKSKMSTPSRISTHEPTKSQSFETSPHELLDDTQSPPHEPPAETSTQTQPRSAPPPTQDVTRTPAVPSQEDLTQTSTPPEQSQLEENQSTEEKRAECNPAGGDHNKVSLSTLAQATVCRTQLTVFRAKTPQSSKSVHQRTLRRSGRKIQAPARTEECEDHEEGAKSDAACTQEEPESECMDRETVIEELAGESVDETPHEAEQGHVESVQLASSTDREHSGPTPPSGKSSQEIDRGILEDVQNWPSQDSMRSQETFLTPVSNIEPSNSRENAISHEAPPRARSPPAEPDPEVQDPIFDGTGEASVVPLESVNFTQNKQPGRSPINKKTKSKEKRDKIARHKKPIRKAAQGIADDVTSFLSMFDDTEGGLYDSLYPSVVDMHQSVKAMAQVSVAVESAGKSAKGGKSKWRGIVLDYCVVLSVTV